MVRTRAGHSPVRAWWLAPVLAMLLAVAGLSGATTATADPGESGAFAGTVLLPGGAPAGDVTVEVIDANAWYGQPTTRVTTASDGTYEVSVAPGSYLLRFVDASGDHLWSLHQGSDAIPDAAYLASATLVAAGETVSVDHTLIRSGSLRGKITLPAGADPTDMAVTAYYPRPPIGNAPRTPAQSGRIAADGTYVIPLRDGDYVLEFTHPDELVEGTSLSVRVTAPGVTTIDVAPRRTNSISGVVRVPAASAGETVRVLATTREQDGSWGWGKSVEVKAGEPYLLAGLPTGTYYVQFYPASGSSALTTSFWPGVSFVEEATEVPVAGGTDRAGVDGELVVGGVVTGRVDPSLGLYPGSTTVELWREVTSDSGPATWKGLGTSHVTEDDGSFRIRGVSAGRYRLQAEGLQGADWEIFHPGVRTVEAAKDFEVTLGQTTTGVDVTVPQAETPDPEPVLKALKRLKAPKVTGRPKVGRTLKVSKGVWKPKSVKVRYQWFAKKGNKSYKVKTGKKSKLALKKSTRGKKYRVVVTVSKKGYKTVKFTSKWSRKIKK
ncbi:carboxypeptidase-like regulatory domain-containing protein [Nocardioides gilvus]|uniref:carboxypeptidase-like regulatory domain-containing protein n=1 Tax=Nocardioides gilvus TaxID=1735589 RepID=UPI0013A56C4C|nr:carboxypeptidase-like regulatory domain-containing protein [Nocardioides gilvus]